MERYIPDRIKRRVGFKKEFDTVLKTHFKLKKYAKGDTLFIQNELCNKVFFIKRGIVKKFYINVDGNEITADFAMEGNSCSQPTAWQNLCGVSIPPRFWKKVLSIV